MVPGACPWLAATGVTQGWWRQQKKPYERRFARFPSWCDGIKIITGWGLHISLSHKWLGYGTKRFVIHGWWTHTLSLLQNPFAVDYLVLSNKIRKRPYHISWCISPSLLDIGGHIFCGGAIVKDTILEELRKGCFKTCIMTNAAMIFCVYRDNSYCTSRNFFWAGHEEWKLLEWHV